MEKSFPFGLRGLKEDRNKKGPKISSRGKRRRILTRRRNIRQGIRRNRNRLERAENNIRNNGRGNHPRFRKFNNFNIRRNLRLKIVFIRGLPEDIDNKRLYGLFRREGKIIGCKLVFNRMGLSKGYGFITFRNPRDAWRTIQKWNNTRLGGNELTVEYKRQRRYNTTGYRNNNFSNYGNKNRTGFNSYQNYYGYNQLNRGGYGIRGRGGFPGRFRGRGRGRF